MNHVHTSSQTAFGFLSVEEIEGVGHCGGLLVVSGIGRPIEFHCCSPVSVNRAQSILYGKTYNSFLYGEQIGLSLIEKTKTQPHLYLANRAELLVLNDLISTPTVFLASREEGQFPDNIPGNLASNATRLEREHDSLWCVNGESETITGIQSILNSFTNSLPLDEPFERIQKAIEEAQAVAR